MQKFEARMDVSDLKTQQSTILKVAPAKNSIWQHYKGDYYKVNGSVMHETSSEILVTYKSCKSHLPMAWARPLREWNQDVFVHDGSEGDYVPRFKKVSQLWFFSRTILMYYISMAILSIILYATREPVSNLVESAITSAHAIAQYVWTSIYIGVVAFAYLVLLPITFMKL
jgi:hypothetical protein